MIFFNIFYLEYVDVNVLFSAYARKPLVITFELPIIYEMSVDITARWEEVEVCFWPPLTQSERDSHY
jgi:hypothetical protein